MGFDKREFDRWILQAENAFKSAVNDRDSGYYNWSCFKSQQAAEYAVKGLLYGIGLSAVGHSILKLLGELRGRKVAVAEDVVICARRLDRHYIPTRYANAYAEGAPYEFYDVTEADEGLKCARMIIVFVGEVAKRWI